jgi:hypothetical protein
MKIVQATVLVLVGAIGAMLYVKVKGGPEPVPEAQPLAQPITQPIAAEPSPTTAREPESSPAPARQERKHHPRVMASSLRKNDLTSRPADIQPAPETRPTPAPNASANAPAPVAEPAPQPAEPPAPPAPPPLRQATLKSGTLLQVRLIETISSDKNHPGDIFNGTLDAPLVVDGLVLAEKGARVEGKIVESQQAGRVKGLASLALALTSLNLSDGQHVEISTDSFSKMGPTSKGTDAAKIGGGAALGAIIGAIAGGGKGAAIGTGVGGAAGTGDVLATRGKPAILPSETKISFRLNNSVTVTERRRRS